MQYIAWHDQYPKVWDFVALWQVHYLTDSIALLRVKRKATKGDKILDFGVLVVSCNILQKCFKIFLSLVRWSLSHSQTKGNLVPIWWATIFGAYFVKMILEKTRVKARSESIFEMRKFLLFHWFLQQNYQKKLWNS